MLTLTTCPTCHHKFTTPEANMGKRHTCPNCQSLFVAGKSVSESDGTSGRPVPETDGRASPRSLLETGGRASPRSMLEGDSRASGPAARPVNRVNVDKTMLGETDAPLIRYNCPRCKKPLEAPASEAGTKKPCPSCGGRLQVPAAPPAPAAAAQSTLNKTMLGETDAPAALPPAEQLVHATPPAAPAAASAAPTRALPVPTSGLSPKHKYALGGLAAAVALLAILYFMGKRDADEKYAAAKKEYDAAMASQKQELDKLKAEIAQKQLEMDQQRLLEAAHRKQAEDLQARQEARQRELNRERELAEKNATDAKLAAEAKAKLDQKQRELEEERRAAAEQRALADQKLKVELDAIKRQLDVANQKATTIVTQPVYAPPAYAPWYNPWHHPWGW